MFLDHNRNKQNRQAFLTGFTLIELVLFIFIITITVLIIYLSVGK